MHPRGLSNAPQAQFNQKPYMPRIHNASLGLLVRRSCAFLHLNLTLKERHVTHAVKQSPNVLTMRRSEASGGAMERRQASTAPSRAMAVFMAAILVAGLALDRKRTRLNSSH